MEKIFDTIDKEIKKNLNKLIDNKEWNIYRGEYVNWVEKYFTNNFLAHALTVNSGSSALELSLRSLGIKKGDEVIIPSFTFVATAQAILAVEATPVLADTDKKSFNLDTKFIEKKLTKKTKAVIFVHLFGNPSNIKQVANFCEKHKIYLVEDCAQALGASYDKKPVGIFGDCAAFSFNNAKHVSCGDGGLLLTKHKKIYEKAKAIRHAGLIQRTDGKFVSKYIGGKMLMTEFQAAILKPQLEKLKILLTHRKKNAEICLEKLSKYNFTLQQVDKKAIHAYQRIVFLAQDKNQAHELLVNNKFLERIYPIPLVEEPIVKKTSKISGVTKKNAKIFWNRHVGFTFMPFVDYTNFSQKFKIK